MEGWIKLHRKICHNWLWEEKPFSRGQAFIDLLLMANYNDKKFMLGSEVMQADIGSVVTSKVKLAERWGWGRKKITLFLKALESDGMITVESDSKRTVINIVNFGVYQNAESTEEHQGNIKGTQTIKIIKKKMKRMIIKLPPYPPRGSGTRVLINSGKYIPERRERETLKRHGRSLNPMKSCKTIS